MCITSKKSEMKSTKIASLVDYYTGRHHLVYANNVHNLHRGPNCLILPIPGEIIEVHDTTAYHSFMDELADNFREPVGRGLSTAKGKGNIVIKEVGVYTVLICNKIVPDEIMKTLKKVDHWKRPDISEELMSWYASFYGKNAQLLICCFDNLEMEKAQPVWVEYAPFNMLAAFYPAVDSHNGEPPQMDKWVDRDHQLYFGVIGPRRYESYMKRCNFSASVPQIFKEAYWRKFNDMVQNGPNCDWNIELQPKAKDGIGSLIGATSLQQAFKKKEYDIVW